MVVLDLNKESRLKQIDLPSIKNTTVGERKPKVEGPSHMYWRWTF